MDLDQNLQLFINLRSKKNFQCYINSYIYQTCLLICEKLQCEEMGISILLPDNPRIATVLKMQSIDNIFNRQ